MDALDALKLETLETTQVQSALDQTGLDQDSFLRIFLAQLEHQDPLNPQDATEMGAQLAQYSQLEQSIRSNTELEGINDRLDQLIETMGGGTAYHLDPLAMIGREVDFGVQIPAAGPSEPLRIDLGVDSRSLRIEVQDRNGEPLGLAEILGSGPDGQASNLPRGGYQLVFHDGQPGLVVPDGGETDLVFYAYRDGTRQVDPGVPPVRFEPRTTYQFSVAAEDTDGGVHTPHTSSGGTVEAVHIVNGQPVLSVSGQEVDPTQVLRIR